MKALLLPALIFLLFATHAPAQSHREVVRDASGRIVQTIDRPKSTGATVQATTRDASGRLTGFPGYRRQVLGMIDHSPE